MPPPHPPFFSLSSLSGGSEERYSFLQGHRCARPLFSERDHRSSADGVSLLWKQQLQGLVWGSVGQQQILGLHHQGCQRVSECQYSDEHIMSCREATWWIRKRGEMKSTGLMREEYKPERRQKEIRWRSRWQISRLHIQKGQTICYRGRSEGCWEKKNNAWVEEETYLMCIKNRSGLYFWREW